MKLIGNVEDDPKGSKSLQSHSFFSVGYPDHKINQWHAVNYCGFTTISITILNPLQQKSHSRYDYTEPIFGVHSTD